MNTNKLNKIAYLALVILVSLSLNSCSSDDDKDNTPSSNDKLNFTGLWEPTGGTNYAPFFYNDGIVSVDGKIGSWTYSENTEILATSVNLQWQITLKTDDEWSGLSLHRDDRRSVSYIRNTNNEDLADRIINGEWSSTNGDKLVFSGCSHIHLIKTNEGGYSPNGHYYVDAIKYDNKKDMMKVIYYGHEDSVEIYHPYNYGKSTLHASFYHRYEGSYSGEFTRIKIK